MPHIMIMLYFRLHCFHVVNSTYFLHSTLVLSFYIKVVMTLFWHRLRLFLNKLAAIYVLYFLYTKVFGFLLNVLPFSCVLGINPVVNLFNNNSTLGFRLDK